MAQRHEEKPAFLRGRLVTKTNPVKVMYNSFLFVILFTLSRAENQQVNKLLDDYFEWKIDTFKVTYLFTFNVDLF